MLYKLCGFICGLLGKPFSQHHFLYCYLDNIPEQRQLVLESHKNLLCIYHHCTLIPTHTQNFHTFLFVSFSNRQVKAVKSHVQKKKKKRNRGSQKLSCVAMVTVIKLPHEPQVQQLQHSTVMWDTEYEHGVHRRKHIIQILV